MNKKYNKGFTPLNGRKANLTGFTLIELLVVIAIIGLLSTLAIVALNNARQKSRDARRVSDIKQIQTALELYYNDANGYPSSIASGGAISYSGTTYMSVVPTA
ncbi:MAG: prepilin-type N-terminal cleavage/methylation domain-containing protein, partial [Patescibacteria group bacterium]